MPRLLAISGSLRLASSNTSLLQAAELLAPTGTSIAHYREVGRLPHFNPDLDDHIPDIVVDLRAQIEEADGLLISCPEYARGIPGSFKNMLDWLVGSLSFPGKPVALFNASPRASEAQAALRLVLETMSARLVNDASISVHLLSKGMSADAIAMDPTIAPVIVNALDALTKAITEAR
jgi:chromate reductase, NAD(P)H dehydrogenase (quinone)